MVYDPAPSGLGARRSVLGPSAPTSSSTRSPHCRRTCAVRRRYGALVGGGFRFRVSGSGSQGAISISAEMNWLDSVRPTSSTPPRSSLGLTRTGRRPSCPTYSMTAPRRRSSFTPSATGRSRMRGLPSTVTGSAARHAAAIMKRAGAPPSPRLTAPPLGKRPATPRTKTSCPARRDPAPSVASALRSRSVSSATSGRMIRDSPSASAASRYARQVWLLEPGGVRERSKGLLSGSIGSGSGSLSRGSVRSVTTQEKGARLPIPFGTPQRRP